MQGIEPCASCSQSKHATDAPHPVGLLNENQLYQNCQLYSTIISVHQNSKQ